MTTRDLLQWISDQKKSGAKPNSINRRLSCIESFYRFSFGREVAQSKRRVSYPSPYYRKHGRHRARGLFVRRLLSQPRLRVKVPKLLLDPLEVEEVGRFLNQLRRYRDKAIVLLMLFCGLRSHEVRGLKLENVDFINQKIRILGKGGKERVLPIPERVIQLMKKYLALERPEICTTDHFFVVLHADSRGEAMTESGLRTIFRNWRLRSGVNKARPHNFRHAFGTNMARYGVSLPVLQKMMGHAEFKTTMRYINLAMTDVQEEYSKALSKIEEKYERTSISE